MMMSTYQTDSTTGLRDAIIAYAHDHLPAIEGMAARDMSTRRVSRMGHERKSEYATSVGGITTHFIAAEHPTYGTYYARVVVEGGRIASASWEYDGENREVNGVIYDSRREARAVKEALSAAGIGHMYPGCPEARRAMKKAGVLRAPKAIDTAGCDE